MKNPIKYLASAMVMGGCALWLAPGEVMGANLLVSIGVRETGTTAAIGDNGGTANGIEWIDLDLNSVALDGTWQLVSFDLANPTTVTPFAGGSADGVLISPSGDNSKGTLEHIRFRNADGITDPITVWLDDLTETVDPPGPTPPASFFLGWEGLTLGSEFIFQEPNFSGSTAANLLPGGVSQVTDTMAHTGVQSYQVDFQFVDATDTRWVRLTTFNTPAGPNPTIDLDGELSFWVKGVPEPASLGLFALGGLAMLRRR